MSRVQFTVQAGGDLEEIDEFISLDNPDAVARLLLSIQEKCALLSRQPQMGRSRFELSPELRGFPVGNYLIFYRPVTDGIEVIRVLHGARDIPELFD
ncbi:MAG: type II toxin-antitoxin system RelE/ParE family toxin [Verrucomicrobiota bacterium]|jgi:toxin ParE1/3/4